MRNKYLIPITLFFPTIFLFCQKVTVDYDFQYCSEGEIEQYKSRLFIYKNSCSLFEVYEHSTEESVNFSNNSGAYEVSVVGSTDVNRKIFKDFVNKKYFYYKQHLDDILKISDPIENISWNIAYNDTKTILEMECKKATGKLYGKDYTVWYTSKIPYSDGPWKFNGLPGIILQVSDSEECFKIEAEKIKINANDELMFNNDLKFTKSFSWDEYILFMQKFLTKMSKFTSNSGEYNVHFNILKSIEPDYVITMD